MKETLTERLSKQDVRVTLYWLLVLIVASVVFTDIGRPAPTFFDILRVAPVTIGAAIATFALVYGIELIADHFSDEN
jgi:hypothetical protein